MIAKQILEIKTPKIKTEFKLTKYFNELYKIKQTIKAPNIAPILTDKKGKITGVIIINEAPRLAPLLTPKTYGPARGLLNKTCITCPEIEIARPARMTVNIFGNLYLNKM